MMDAQNDSLFPFLHDYLKIYLPKQRKASVNTVRSYRKSLEALLDYAKEQLQLPLGSITFEHLTVDLILSFMEQLKSDADCAASTYNTRLAAIRAFMEYAAGRDIALAATLEKLKKISFEKPVNSHIVEFMSMETVSAIVEQTDANTAKGLRDRVFIILLYDTGARVQEMLDIRLCDLQFGSTPKVTLHGKGRKTRVVPLMARTVQHLRKYLSEFHRGELLSSDMPLFYSVRSGMRNKLTDRLIRYMLQKYGQMAKTVCQDVPENVHPHLFRHSRAMHLYQEGMDLTLISQWLGHSQLETTLIYAYADTEQKRKAIAAATPKDNPLYAKLNPARCTVTDEETLKRLTGLR